MAFDVYAPPHEIESVYSKVFRFCPNAELMERIKQSQIPVVCGICGEAFNPHKPDEVELMMVETVITLRRVGEDGKLVNVPTIWRVFYCKPCLLEVINFGNADPTIGNMFQ